MNLAQTLTAFEKGLTVFMQEDPYLLERDIAERDITHKLAERLVPFFPGFHIDCEYNGDIDNQDSYRKTLEISQEELIEIAKKKIRVDETYAVYPDIIIHTRNINQNNHVVIEVKKVKHSKEDQKFDVLKLQKFTAQYHYRLGIYLEFQTGNNFGVRFKKNIFSKENSWKKGSWRIFE